MMLTYRQVEERHYIVVFRLQSKMNEVLNELEIHDIKVTTQGRGTRYAGITFHFEKK